MSRVSFRDAIGGRGRALVAALAVLAAALVAVACGGEGSTESGGGEGSSDGELTPLTVGVIPIADVAPLYVGIEQGFFEDEGLEIETQAAAGGAAIVPSVVSGDFQIGFSNTTSLLIASSEGLPLEIVSQGSVGGERPEEGVAWDGLLVPEDSDVREPADLEGATIAVNTLNNVSPLVVNTELREAGVDPASVEYAEIEFPDMVGALAEGRVDAAHVVEPFLSQGLADGNRTVFYPYEETAQNLTVATWFTSAEYAEQDPETVDAFARAMAESQDFAEENPDVVREVIPEYTEIPPEAADQITLPGYGSDLNEETIAETARLAESYGFLGEEPVDVDELIRESP